MKRLKKKKKKKKKLTFFREKILKKVHDPRNAKEHHQLFLRKKNRKSVKQSETITSQLKTFEKTSIIDIESVTTEHLKS